MKNILDKIINLFSQETSFTGAILPSEKELQKEIKFEEIVALATEPQWKDLDLNKLPKWIQYDQFYGMSCVANTDSLIDTILYYKRFNNLIKFSPAWKYSHRINRPQAGMVGTDAFRISKEVGAIPYDLCPSPVTEAQLNNMYMEPWFKDIAKVFQTEDSAILVPVRDIDTLVSIQQVTDKPIMVWFAFTSAEWQYVPKLGNRVPNLHHSVTFIAPKNPDENSYGYYNGEKAIVVQDSAFLTTAKDGKRIITESFFKARNTFVAYKMRFKFEVSENKPKFDGSVISLQKCLRSIGLFPANISFVENLGPVTKEALMKFQKQQNIPQTGKLDDVTNAVLRKVF